MVNVFHVFKFSLAYTLTTFLSLIRTGNQIIKHRARLNRNANILGKG